MNQHYGTSSRQHDQTQHQQGQQASSGPEQGYRFPTASYLPAGVRESTIRELNQTLADLTVMQTQARFAHWNVKGMAFYGLHELFGDLAEALGEHVDLVAERITALGGQAMGTAGQAVSSCRLPAMPTNPITGEAYVDVVTERLAILDASLAEAIEAADQHGDVDTADLLNEVSREVSQYRWFVEAHRQTQPIGRPAQSAGESAMAGQPGQPTQTGPGDQPGQSSHGDQPGYDPERSGVATETGAPVAVGQQ